MHIIIFIGTVNLLLLLITYFYYRINFPLSHSLSFGLIYLFLACNNIISRVLPETAPLLLIKASSWLGGLWMAFAYYSLLLAVLHLLLWLASKFIGFPLPSEKLALVGVIAIFCFIAWGSINAYSPVVRTERITTAKLSHGENYKIVFLSDIHLGRLLGKDYAQRLTERVNQLQPDLVLVAGDVLDEKQAYVLKENSLAPLGQLKVPKGVFMAYGNHDYLDQPLSWQKRLEEQNIQVLRDSYAFVDGRIKLVGLEDYSKSKDVKELKRLSSNNQHYYTIILDHQPRRMQAASEAGYDLYLAGHTHTGQLFPNRLITKRMYLLDYSRAAFDSMTAITNNGYGYWGTPIRTEKAPEIVLIQLIGTGK